MTKKLAVIACGLLLGISVGAIELAICNLADAIQDSWNDMLSEYGLMLGPIAQAVVAIAPFGLFPVITMILVSFAYISCVWSRPLHFHHLATSVILAVLSVVGLGISIEVAKLFLCMNGSIIGTPLAWVLHSLIVLVLATLGVRGILSNRTRASNDVPHDQGLGTKDNN